MNIFRITIFWLLVLALKTPRSEGGEFINLGFDQPLIPREPGTDKFPKSYRGPASVVVPGWTVRLDGNLLTTIMYSSVGDSDFGVTLKSAPNADPTNGSNFKLEVLSYRPSPDIFGDPIPAPVTIEQRGRIPEWAKELRYYGGLFPKINGADVPIGLAERPYYLSIDVTPYAGQEVKLQFSSPGGGGDLFDIQGFVPQVPEPSPWALAAAGIATIGFVGWIPRKHSLAHTK